MRRREWVFMCVWVLGVAAEGAVAHHGLERSRLRIEYGERSVLGMLDTAAWDLVLLCARDVPGAFDDPKFFEGREAILAGGSVRASESGPTERSCSQWCGGRVTTVQVRVRQVPACVR